MRLRPLDRVEEVRFGDLSLGLNRRRPVGRLHRTQRHWLTELRGQAVDAGNGFGIAFLDRLLLSPHVRDKLEPVAHVVETGERVDDDEDAVRHLQGVSVRDREVLEISRRLVAEVADGATAESFGKPLGWFGSKRLEV